MPNEYDLEGFKFAAHKLHGIADWRIGANFMPLFRLREHVRKALREYEMAVRAVQGMYRDAHDDDGAATEFRRRGRKLSRRLEELHIP